MSTFAWAWALSFVSIWGIHARTVVLGKRRNNCRSLAALVTAASTAAIRRFALRPIKRLLAFLLLCGMALAPSAHAMTRCMDDAWEYASPDAMAKYYASVFVNYDGQGSLMEYTLSRDEIMAAAGAGVQYAIPGGYRIEERRFSPFYSTDQPIPDSTPTRPYTYLVDITNRHTKVTTCYDVSGCTAPTEAVDLRVVCVEQVPSLHSISLSGSPTHVTSRQAQKIVLSGQLTLAGIPVANAPFQLTTPVEGTLICDPWCSATDQLQTDSDGWFHITFRPAQPLRAPATFAAGCSTCGNTATWTPTLEKNIVIGFFNGVSNTEEAAQKSLDRLEIEFGSQYKEAPLRYAQFYNQTDCNGGFCLEDMAETFEQRSQALNGVFTDRWETFWDILAGRHQQDNSFTGRLLNLLGNGSNALLQWLDTTAIAVLNQLVNNTLRMLTLFSESPTAADRADHNTRLWQYADDDNQLLLVAHSQGNLFVNSAYDTLMKYKPEAKAKVVHVAPAAPTLRGDHVLADIDLVINALRGTGLNSVPDVNINLPLSKIDLTGHSFEPTYLDKSRAAYARTRGMITSSLDALTQ